MALALVSGVNVVSPLLALVIASAACSSASSKSDANNPDGQPPELGDLAPAREIEEGRFATSLVCASCHSNSPDADAMRDDRGNEIAPFDLWSSTMMANATRDPLWRAVVSAEVAAIPSRRGDIEATCMKCHAPMASTEAALNGEAPVELALVYGDTARSQLSLDGVSCAACHQIRDTNLGTPSSFSGNYVIGDDRAIFGPHANPFAMPMERHTGYRPQQADHISRSSMCASCHTLHTQGLRPDGSETGETLAEQTPYLEWQRSAFTTEIATPGPDAADCQDCHMPSKSEAGVAIATALARNPGGFDFPPLDARAPFSRHVFVGGNTLIPQLLRDNPVELAPLASREAFNATIALARAQLSQRTATLAIEGATISSGRIRATIAITNLAGHKFPTAHPSRRAWLHVKVTGPGGAIVFESGRHDSSGALIDSAGVLLPSELAGGPALSHQTTLGATSDPLVYETVMADSDGAVTYRLLQGVRYLKDNRLLPRGWSPVAGIEPIGVNDDEDFVGGGDRVVLDVAVSATGTHRVELWLLYQPLGARYAAELFAVDTPEVRALRAMLERADRAPEVVASAQATIAVP